MTVELEGDKVGGKEERGGDKGRRNKMARFAERERKELRWLDSKKR